MRKFYIWVVKVGSYEVIADEIRYDKSGTTEFYNKGELCFIAPTSLVIIEKIEHLK